MNAPYIELTNTNQEIKSFGSFYLALIVFFQVTDYSFGLYRSLSLVAMLLLALAIALVSKWPDLAAVHWMRAVLPRWTLAASLVPLLYAAHSASGALRIGNPIHRVRTVDSLIVGSVIMAVFLSTCVAGLRGRAAFRNAVSLVLVGSLLIPLSNIVQGLAVCDLYDIATTTADAARAMWAGLNPYDLHIDLYASQIVHSDAYDGYKYLPTMAIFYGVFGFFFDLRGIVVANILLYAAVAGVIFCLCRRLTGQAGWFAVMLFLSTPINSVEALAGGATDIAPVFLILVAFLLWGRSSLLTGILIGLSLSMKLAPGLFAAPLCLPSNRPEWRRYLVGIAIGALPALPYFIWSPINFVDNVVLFNIIRAPDNTTWRYDAPTWVGRVAMMASLLAFAGATLWCLVARVGLLARLYAFFAITVGILLAAASNHDNYAIWWTPVLVILLGTLGAQPRKSEGGPAA